MPGCWADVLFLPWGAVMFAEPYGFAPGGLTVVYGISPFVGVGD